MKSKEGKILGVLGGMGPAATHLFYEMIIENTQADCDQDHINMIILNHATMPDRTTAIKNNKKDMLLEKLAEDAKVLEDGGASYIAVPCNTSHVILDELQKRVNLPIINMIEETAAYIDDQDAKKVGILATDGTIETNLYQKACEKLGITAIAPSEESQEKIMDIIYENVKKGIMPDGASLKLVEEEMKKRECEYCILGCTELSIVKKELHLDDYYVDAMEILARKSIELCGGKLI